MAYAIFVSGGQQYRVVKGDTIFVDRIDSLEEGAETTFSNVLMVENDGNVKIGTPTIEGATISAKVVKQCRAAKVIAFKYKKRKGFHKKKGFRRSLTRLEITGINA